MRHAGLVVDGRPPSTLAADYQGGVRDTGVYYSAFLQLYADIRDVYAFNRAYFAGRLLHRATLERTLAPRDFVKPPDPNVDESRWGYRWHVGTTLGHQVIYFTSNANDFSIADFYFPGPDVTVIILSNERQNDVESIALHLASGALGVPLEPQHVALAPSVSPSKAIVGKVTVPYGFTLTGSSNAVWVPQPVSGKVVRIDPASNRIVAHVKVAGRYSVGHDKVSNALIAARGDQIWTAEGLHRSVDRIDPVTNRVVKRIPVGILPFGVALGGRWLWTTHNSYEDPGGKHTIVQVDLRTERVVARLTNDNAPIGQPFLQLAATPDALWYEEWTSGTIKRVDAVTHKVIATIRAGIAPTALAVGAGSVWTGNHNSDLVTRINPATNTLQATIPLQGYPSGQPGGDCCGGTIIVGAGAVWAIAGSGARPLVRIDPATNEVTSALTFPQSLGYLAIAGSSVWAQVSDADVIYRIEPKAMP
jgi:YVTN family beta-propeller protein